MGLFGLAGECTGTDLSCIYRHLVRHLSGIFWHGKAAFIGKAAIHKTKASKRKRRRSSKTMGADFKKLQNGSDIRGVALEGIQGEKVNL